MENNNSDRIGHNVYMAIIGVIVAIIIGSSITFWSIITVQDGMKHLADLVSHHFTNTEFAAAEKLREKEHKFVLQRLDSLDNALTQHEQEAAHFSAEQRITKALRQIRQLEIELERIHPGFSIEPKD